MGVDEPCKIVGMGKVHIKLNNGNEWMLKDVRHIPVMKRNMISTGKLGDSSCLSTFGKMWWKITRGVHVISKRDRIGMLYLCPHNTDYSISVASTKIGAAFWHHRLSHMSKNGMQILQSRKLLSYMKHVNLEFCENYVYGKHKS